MSSDAGPRRWAAERVAPIVRGPGHLERRRPITTTLRTTIHAAAAATDLALTAPAAVQDLPREVRDRGTLRIGVAGGPAYRYPDPMTGEKVGLNIDLPEGVAEILGVELEIVPASWATQVTGPQVDPYDVISANLLATPERAATVAFIDPCGFHVTMAADSDIPTLEDLDDPGVSFFGFAGTVETQCPHERFPEAQVDGLVTDRASEAPTAVLSGRSDAVPIDPGFYRIPTAQNPAMAERVRLLNGEDAPLKPISLSCATEHRDTDRLQFLDAFIRDEVADGAIAPARDAWFDEMADQQARCWTTSRHLRAGQGGAPRVPLARRATATRPGAAPGFAAPGRQAPPLRHASHPPVSHGPARSGGRIDGPPRGSRPLRGPAPSRTLGLGAPYDARAGGRGRCGRRTRRTPAPLGPASGRVVDRPAPSWLSWT